MFSLKKDNLDLSEPLAQGRFGLIFPYRSNQGNKERVEVASVTTSQLPEIIEEIVIGFSCNHPNTIPIKGFYMKPVEKVPGKINEWKVYIKQLLDQDLKEINRNRYQGIRHAAFNFNKACLKEDVLIEKGGFGSVYAYEEGPKDEKWVVKIVSATNARLPRIVEEIMIGFSCNHPNVLRIEGFYMEPNHGDWKFYIKMPRMKESLKAKIERHKNTGPMLTKQEVKNYVDQIVAGLKYLHTRKIAHRDLKPGNILLDHNGKVLIADFGEAIFAAEESEHVIHNRASTKVYRAPELLEKGPALKKEDLFKADVWSLGLLLAEICFVDINLKTLQIYLIGFKIDYFERKKTNLSKIKSSTSQCLNVF